ncbi:lipid IV(A) 3-deoxy-D-manno-octulosonic acid transferase [Pseudidiomarina homiensis]|uniref:lipid IV(A) 3-deoxy-D-manno-octulosonic acid transferase n=1 Tax=Pseudidiomarina homiensis TaxID=364198 RepID=UPI00215B0CAD|nr:lipid IV(A) 3-deoxy-D-manno-octulosonic acid transferase [Pseudidiomarina homiensis]
MTAVYRLLIRLLMPAVFVYLWLRGRKAPAYRERWNERLALQSIPARYRHGLLIHCVSVGETVAARQLIETLLNDYPQVPITLSSMTPTAAELAYKLFGDRVHHLYLPFDTPGAMRRFFTNLAPCAVLILETEIWPCFVREAQRRKVPVLLLNARMSEKSFSSYHRFAWLLGPIWRELSWVAAQTQASLERFVALGVPAERSALRGNLKFDSHVPMATLAAATAMKQRLERPIWVAASTHKGEDELLLAAFKQILSELPTALLILVPRHPERFASVGELVAREGFTYVTRSSGTEPQAQHQVLLGDSMGELLLWYALADVAFVGGSLITRGGHNPLEPVATHTPVVSGPHVFNFKDIYQRLTNARAVRFADTTEQIARHTLELLCDAQLRHKLQCAAQREFAQDQGATAAMLADIKQQFSQSQQGVPLAMQNVEVLQPTKGETIWYRQDRFGEFSAAFFSADYWRQQGQIKGAATGRSTAWFIASQPTDMLLRHYYRGGLVGKLNKDRFKREPVAVSRAMAEFELLLKLSERGLPVPEPLAARYVKAPGWGYRADILVAVIPTAKDVFKLLGERHLREQEWNTLGQAIRLLHEHRVYHSDLNCHNLMLDEAGKAWIVDFDKCGFREPGDWAQANLARLLRSFNKELGKAKEAKQDFHWQEARDWPLLLAGYQAN